MERVSIIHWLKTFWQRRNKGASQPSAEVERIAALQQAAVQRRAEYAAAQEPAGSDAEVLASLRERVQKAESAYAAALQAWDNKQFRR